MTRPLPTQLAALSDVGKVRSNNEDSYFAYIPPLQEAEKLDVRAVLVVADGMGGHALGELASQTAVKAFAEGLFASLAKHKQPMEQALRDAVSYANDAVYQLAQGEAKGRPGTTLTALVLRSDSFYIAHVGDSRAYLLRDGQLRQLTTDHTWVAQEVAQGRMKLHEAKNSPFRNYLTRALGSKPTVEADILAGGLKEGDLFLLCSDGLTNYIRDNELAALLRNSVNLQETCAEMVAIANERGGHDNITVILAQVGLKQPTKPSFPMRQTEIPSQPYIPRPTIKKRKRLQWEQVVLMVLLSIAVGLSLGWFIGWIASMWQQLKSPQHHARQILRPQKSMAIHTKPTFTTIALQVQLLPNGLQFATQGGRLEAIGKSLNPQRKDEKIFVEFRYPEKSHSALAGGQAKIVLRKGNEEHECSFQGHSVCSISLQEGEWEVRYIAEPKTDLSLCILRLEVER